MTFLFLESTPSKILYVTFKSQTPMILSVNCSPFSNHTSIENGMYVSSENLCIKIISKPVGKAVISFLIYLLIYKSHFRTIQFIILANIKLITHTHLTSPKLTNDFFFFLTCPFKFIRTKDFNPQYRLYPFLQLVPEPHLAEF